MPELEVWAEPECGGWTVGMTHHAEAYVTLVRKGLTETQANDYKDRLLIQALDLAA